jgi:hypothetical protein
MKTLTVTMLVAAGLVINSGAVFGQTPGDAGSPGETGPGDRLGGSGAGISGDPSVYRSPASAGPGGVEYPSASPRGAPTIAPPAVIVVPPGTGVVVEPSSRVPGVVVAPPVAGVVVEPLGPVMCPAINLGDPRPC